MLTFEQIKELIQIVSERRLQGLEVERSGFRLKIDGRDEPSEAGRARTAEPAAAASVGGEPSASASQTREAEPRESGAPEPPEQDEKEGPPAGAHVVKSPIVGTFYRAPSPDADPFVREGDRVQKGQVLCIVEAMKLMNEIEAEVAGKILEIYPEDAQPVEFGEPLFAVEPA